MDEEAHIARQISKAFPNTTLYEIFEVPEDASSEDIKKAYRKKALVHHPDKGGDPEKFKALSCAHAILSNSEKRKLYDQTGELDGSDLSAEAAEWNMYFRNLFPKLTVEAIEKFSTKYKNSEEERTDILQAYVLRKGNLEDIMESVILAEEEDTERIVEIINGAIDSGELTEYAKWQSSCSSSIKSKPRKSISLSGKTKKKCSEVNDNLLIQMISNKNRQADQFANICAKYSKENSPKNKRNKQKISKINEYEISDAEFEKLRADISKRK